MYVTSVRCIIYISECSMNKLKGLCDIRAGFLDPSIINQGRQDWPLKLADDSKDLVAGTTKEERDEIRHALHRREKKKVAAYINNALTFFHEQNRDEIYTPYNFEYVKTTLAVYTGCKLNTHDLI